jgi:hypothetical protein
MFDVKLRQFRGIKIRRAYQLPHVASRRLRCCSVSLGFKTCSYLRQINSLDRRTVVTNIVQGLMRTTIQAGRMRSCLVTERSLSALPVLQ